MAQRLAHEKAHQSEATRGRHRLRWSRDCLCILRPMRTQANKYFVPAGLSGAVPEIDILL